MLNMMNMLTSRQTFRVELTRKPTINEGQNVRRKVDYVKAPNEADAKRLAERNNPAFKAGKTRRV